MIGVGVGVGVGGGAHVASAAGLTSWLQGVLGSDLTGLMIGDVDIAGTVGGTITGNITDRVGAGWTRFSANPMYVTEVHGRRALDPHGVANTCYYGDRAATVKTIVVATQGSPKVIDYETWVVNNNDGANILVRNAGSGALYNSPWSHRINGGATAVFPESGDVLVECTNTSSASAAVSWGGYLAVNRPAPTPIALLLTCSRSFSDADRAAVMPAIARFCRFAGVL